MFKLRMNFSVLRTQKVWPLGLVFTLVFTFLTPSLLNAQTKGEEAAPAAASQTVNSTEPLSNETQQSLFNQGLLAYQNQKFVDAVTLFQKALSFDKNNLAVLTNLGMASLKIDQKGWSAAYLRKALALDHHFAQAQSALNQTLQKLEVKELPRKLSMFENFREEHLRFWSLDFILVLNALLLFVFIWRGLSYLGTKKRNQEAESTAPAAPMISLFAGFAFVLTAALAGWKIQDAFFLSRGTVVVKKSSIYTAPEPNQNSLFEAVEGLEVYVLGASGDYYQIKYPGSFSGWIEKKHLFVTQ